MAPRNLWWDVCGTHTHNIKFSLNKFCIFGGDSVCERLVNTHTWLERQEILTRWATCSIPPPPFLYLYLRPRHPIPRARFHPTATYAYSASFCASLPPSLLLLPWNIEHLLLLFQLINVDTTEDQTKARAIIQLRNIIPMSTVVPNMKRRLQLMKWKKFSQRRTFFFWSLFVCVALAMNLSSSDSAYFSNDARVRPRTRAHLWRTLFAGCLFYRFINVGLNCGLRNNLDT